MTSDLARPSHDLTMGISCQYCMHVNTAYTFLLVSWISPPMMNSSRMRYTCKEDNLHRAQIRCSCAMLSLS